MQIVCRIRVEGTTKPITDRMNLSMMPTRISAGGCAALLALTACCGCGGGGGGGGVVVNNPPILAQPTLTPATVDFTGQPAVAIAATVTDETPSAVTVTGTVRRQSDGATFALAAFARNGSVFSVNFTAPANGGPAAQAYAVTLSATDGVNPAAVLTANQAITVNAPAGPPGIPF